MRPHTLLVFFLPCLVASGLWNEGGFSPPLNFSIDVADAVNLVESSDDLKMPQGEFCLAVAWLFELVFFLSGGCLGVDQIIAGLFISTIHRDVSTNNLCTRRMYVYRDG